MRKCIYCDFFSVPYDESTAYAYTDALCRELSIKTKFAQALKTVYIGGGTPSLLPDKCFIEIFQCLKNSFRLSPSHEITVEANPGTLDESKIDLLLSLGVNRLSIGVQSFNNEELIFLGRIHTAEEALRSIELIAKAGVKNFSVDLMYAIPGQTFNSWCKTLSAAAGCSPKHISAYELTPEEKTPFYELITLNNNKIEQTLAGADKSRLCHSGSSGIFLHEEGFPASGNDSKIINDQRNSEAHPQKFISIEMPDEEMVLEMYNYAINYLTGNGYDHYEISNFSLPGFRCVHNLNYWDRGAYLAVGAGAHSLISGVRSKNINNIRRYIESLNKGIIPESESNILLPEEALREFIFLGLRKTEGINMNELPPLVTPLASGDRGWYHNLIDASRELIDQGYLEIRNSHLRFTGKGIVISNTIIVKLFEKLGL